VSRAKVTGPVWTPTPRRVLYLCDWLPPDFGAVGQYAVTAAEKLARRGSEVTLVGLSSAGDSVSEYRVRPGRVRVVRLAAAPYDRSRPGERAAWTLAADLRLVAASLAAFAAADEVFFTGSPPFLIQLVVPLNLLLRKRLVYRITDFHPECLIAELADRGRAPGGAAGAGGGVPLWLRAFRRWTLFLRRFVDRFEVLGEDQRTRLLEIGVPEERIELRRDDSPVEIAPGTEPLPRPAELEGRVVLLYSGNFGVAHDDATFVDGYRLHHAAGTGRVALWLNATGAKADRVEARLRELGLPVHRTRPVPLERLASLLVTPDAHLITLRDAFVGYVLPSKVYGCIRSGRPVLFVGSAASDVHLLCSRRLPPGRYLRVGVDDPQGVAEALEQLADLGGGASA
jgi:hypothetical protein